MTTTQTEKRAPREKRTKLWITATTVSMLIYAALITLSLVQPWAIWAAIAAAAIGIGFAVMWVVSLDEAAQQAHYVSWYWGGSVGLTFSMLVFLAVTPHLLRPEGFEAVFDVVPGMEAAVPLAFSAGFMLAILPPVAGYLIWWIALSLSRR